MTGLLLPFLFFVFSFDTSHFSGHGQFSVMSSISVANSDLRAKALKLFVGLGCDEPFGQISTPPQFRRAVFAKADTLEHFPWKLIGCLDVRPVKRRISSSQQRYNHIITFPSNIRNSQAATSHAKEYLLASAFLLGDSICFREVDLEKTTKIRTRSKPINLKCYSDSSPSFWRIRDASGLIFISHPSEAIVRQSFDLQVPLPLVSSFPEEMSTTDLTWKKLEDSPLVVGRVFSLNSKDSSFQYRNAQCFHLLHQGSNGERDTIFSEMLGCAEFHDDTLQLRKKIHFSKLSPWSLLDAGASTHSLYKMDIQSAHFDSSSAPLVTRSTFPFLRKRNICFLFEDRTVGSRRGFFELCAKSGFEKLVLGNQQWTLTTLQ